MYARRLIALLVTPLIVFAACGKDEVSDAPQDAKPVKKGAGKWDGAAAQVEYETLQAELRLAKLERPYLIIDNRTMRLLLKLKGVIVWSYPMQMDEADSDKLDEFVKRFRGNRKKQIRLMIEKHLFAASEKTPDSILAIVGEAVSVNPELLQREVPSRFQLLWNSGLILEVRTDIEGRPTSRIMNTFVEFRHVLQRTFGESRIVAKMTPEEALTLYRVSRPGLPTMIYPRI